MQRVQRRSADSEVAILGPLHHSGYVTSMRIANQLAFLYMLDMADKGPCVFCRKKIRPEGSNFITGKNSSFLFQAGPKAYVRNKPYFARLKSDKLDAVTSIVYDLTTNFPGVQGRSVSHTIVSKTFCHLKKELMVSFWSSVGWSYPSVRTPFTIASFTSWMRNVFFTFSQFHNKSNAGSNDYLCARRHGMC